MNGSSNYPRDRNDGATGANHSTSQAISFLQQWSPDGVWALAAIAAEGGNPDVASFSASTVPEATAWLESRQGKQNLYFTVNEPAGHMQKKPRKEDIARVVGLHVDIDPRANEDLQQERARILELLKAFQPRPTAVLFSGGGIQAFWKFASPIIVRGDEAARARIEQLNQALALEFGADSCHNVDRLMRLPGTINLPGEKKRAKGRTTTPTRLIWFEPELIYEPESFDVLRAKHRIADVSRAGAMSPRVAAMPSDPGANVSALPQWALSLIRTGHADGHNYPSRSEAVYAVACEMARRGFSDAQIIEVLLDADNAISAHVRDKGRGAQAYARRQVQSARAAVAAQPIILDRNDHLSSARSFCERRWPTLLHHNGDWLAYENGAYCELEVETVKSELYHFLENAMVMVEKDGETSTAPFNPNRSKVADIQEALRAVAHRRRDTFEPPCWLDGDGPPAAEILACQNGLLHLPTGALHPATDRFFTRNVLPFDFDARAPAPKRWLQFLSEVWPDNYGECELLQEVMGYMLVPDTSQQKIFVMVGPKRSGKGTIGRTLGHLIGPRNRCSPTLEALGETFGLEHAIGKQLALVSDMRASSKADAAKIAETLLRISGEDEITANRKYKSAWTGRLGIRFLIMTNEMPGIADASGALVSRYVPLVMNNTFYGREDTQLEAKLVSELPGILNWAIQGWRRLKERGHFVLPAHAREVVDQLEDLASPVKAFIRDECELAPDAQESKAAVYRAYLAWCKGNGVFECDAARFGNQLMAATDRRVSGCRPRSEGGRVPHWRGLRLRPQPF